MKIDIHIGELISGKLEEEGRKACWLAKEISCESSNISKIFQKSSIDANLLMDISIALDTNFFIHYIDIYDEKSREKQNKEKSVQNGRKN